MYIRLSETDKILVSASDDVYRIMQRILLHESRIDRDEEHFWVIGLNQIGRIIYIRLESIGSVKQTIVEPMNVFRAAILKSASRIIAVHNHPAGSLRASEQDLDTTDRLIQIGKILNIKLEDHLIITTKGYLSLLAEGYMDELNKSQKYRPAYQLIEQLTAQQQQLAELKQQNTELQKRLKKAEALLKNTIR